MFVLTLRLAQAKRGRSSSSPHFAQTTHFKSGLYRLGLTGGKCDRESLFAETRMGRSKADGACEFPRTNPDRARASDEREGVVSNEFCGALELEYDGIVRVGADAAELVGDAQDDAGGIGSVG